MPHLQCTIPQRLRRQATHVPAVDAPTGSINQNCHPSLVAAVLAMPEVTTTAPIDASDASGSRRSARSLVGQRDERAKRWRAWAPDALTIAALAVVAFITRRGGLPTDGLWHDDAWVVLGATKGSLSHLFTVGADHPGFTLLLMAWTRFGGSIESTSYPAFVAGTLGPPALYLVLRCLGFERSISALLGATLVGAHIHIMYSGRVKTYTLDVLIVLGLVVVVAGLANARWRWYTAVAWVTAATVLGCVSGFALVATAAAGIVLLLHPVSDRTVRFVAVGAQAVLQLVLFVATQRTYDTHELEAFWTRTYDAYLDFDVNPVRFGTEFREHLSRVAHVFPGGGGWWATLCVIIALVAVAVVAVTRRSPPNAVRARYLLFVFLIAIVGGILDKLPFGAGQGWGGPLSPGERASMWLIPLIAVGLAFALQRFRRLVVARRWLRISFDAAAYLVAASVLLVALGRDAPSYPFPGSESAVKYVDSELGRHDAVLVIKGGHYQFALESKFGAVLRPRPQEMVGFVPEFTDPRVHLVDFGFDNHVSQHTRDAIRDVDRVFVYSGTGIYLLQFNLGQKPVLRSEGFRERKVLSFGSEKVWIWQRRPEVSR